MALTPSTVNFTYKKYDPIPPAVLITFSETPGISEAFGVPSYLEVYDITTTSIKVKISTGANAATPGSYTDIITLKYYDTALNKYLNMGSFTANTTIQDTILLSITPTIATFTYQIGGSVPTPKTIAVTSENTWSVAKTQPWLVLSTASGTGTSSFQISVNTTGLAAGTYSDTVTVNDGGTPKTVSVSLTVTDPSTGTDYLYINPTLLNFGYTVSGAIPPSKNVELNASAAWTATASEAWINLPVAAGAAGPAIVEIGLQSLTALTAGNYIATVTFTVGTIIKLVTVNLTVYQFTTELLNNTTLYFTDDETNLIKVASGRFDTFVQLLISSLYKTISYYFESGIPIFQGGAQKRIGSAPKKIIGKQDLIGLADPSISQPYSPIKLNITINEVELFTGVIASTQQISNIKFIKGTKPLTNWLSDLPSVVFLTTKATLCFSILSAGAKPTSIDISGDIAQSIPVNTVDSEFYTVVLPLASITGIAVDKKIKVTVLDQSITVIVREEQIDHSMIYWENNNGCWDSAELVGEVIITSTFNRTLATMRKTEQTSETKIIDVTVPQTFKINTGNINTKAEIDMIDKSLRSKNMYLQTQGFIIPVIPETKNLNPYESLRELNNFDLTFKNTIE